MASVLDAFLAWVRGETGRLDRRREDHLAIIDFEDSWDPLDLPPLLPLALSPDPGVAEAASAAIEKYLGGRAPRELVALDDMLRRAYGWNGELAGPAWRGVTSMEIARRLRAGTRRPAVLGLASFHPSGYVREAAVGELARVRGGAELPYLLIRLNDWVEVVQGAASGAVRERLVPEYAPHFARALWLVMRLGRLGRTRNAALAVEIRALLSGPEARVTLHGCLETSDRWLRRTCYGLLLDAPAGDAPEIVRRALGDEDALIRFRAAREADAVLRPDAVREILPLMDRDPFMPVRREALRIRVASFPETAEPVLRRALFDRSATIRGVARFDLRQRGIADFRAIYRSVVEAGESADVRAALYGLGETGTGDDAGIVERFLEDPAPALRQAAVTALARLAPAESIPAFVRALGDPSAGVSKAARLALAKRPEAVEGEGIWEVFRRGDRTHVRSHALSLLADRGKWEAIGWIIRACGSDDERVARMARQHVRRWIEQFNRNQARPTAEQLERMAQALDEAAAALDSETERMLRFLMKGY